MGWNSSAAKIDAYELMLQQLQGLCEKEQDKIATLANSSALLASVIPDTVFAGYYLFDGNELILGPFQGSVSCTRIQLGKGVCGESAAIQKSVIVDNVKEYHNYISCDAAAQSEIVVPMVKAGRLVGVLDLDSQLVASYDEVDRKYLEQMVDHLLATIAW